jgi:hypothetical protein
MDNARDRVYINLVMVVNMKVPGVMDGILVLVFVRGKMVVVTKGMSIFDSVQRILC